MTSLWNNPHYYRTVRWEGTERVLGCGACRGEVRGIDAWAEHWALEHGTIEEARAHLALRSRRSARTQEIAKMNREHRRSVDRNKISSLPGARVARALAKWWRENWPHCSRCQVPVELKDVAGSAVSFCPRHGLSWEWIEEELFWAAAPPAMRSWARRRLNGTVTSAALRAWVTRRQRGHVTEDARKAWRTRVARFGPIGASPDGVAAAARANRAHQLRHWTNPAYRRRQEAAIREGIRRRRERQDRRIRREESSMRREVANAIAERVEFTEDT